MYMAEQVRSEVPTVYLRDVRDDDESLLTELASADVEGEWNTFDDPEESMLDGAHYGGGRLIIHLSGDVAVGIVT